MTECTKRGKNRDKYQDHHDTYFKGPLETYLLAEEGILLHLPWYGKAKYSNKNTENIKGIEYVSPITVSSSIRVAKTFDGEGKRLKPTGYSLLEYKHENILKIMQRIYPEKEIIEYNDLQDWIYMTQTSHTAWCFEP